MARQHLVTALVLASVASSTVLAVALAPPTPWLAPDMHPLALTLSAAWAVWRLLALDRALAQRRAWHQAAGWVLAPEALASAATPPWWPAWLRHWCSRRGVHRGVLLGRAFRWQAGHTQVLETALVTDGALPIAEDSRGGHPALHAVGQDSERALVVPWSKDPRRKRRGFRRKVSVMLGESVPQTP